MRARGGGATPLPAVTQWQYPESLSLPFEPLSPSGKPSKDTRVLGQHRTLWSCVSPSGVQKWAKAGDGHTKHWLSDTPLGTAVQIPAARPTWKLLRGQVNSRLPVHLRPSPWAKEFSRTDCPIPCSNVPHGPGRQNRPHCVCPSHGHVPSAVLSSAAPVTFGVETCLRGLHEVGGVHVSTHSSRLRRGTTAGGQGDSARQEANGSVAVAGRHRAGHQGDSAADRAQMTAGGSPMHSN